ncbi:HpcH/HpaI aldolase family protein [Flavilitoribacter nigricans]|uniref:Aldolase n=1 Tax=Flavilitoribacter nigricans (strain ATCC 23147 / DSM 23189 / NBRC 102662 / NCIMB 1420 / SS-2) TaxID=1122177 RepID=A0A2D0NCC1_FLAN2|nr:aldolase/citrate lyase family protein [Flavilitoribacter nigricans]PHN05413.1 aldolase [Flavilitoribacter nigricans DSM 23189 = NBRC 102662]
MSFQRDDLKRKLQQGRNVYGTCITVNAPRWPELVAGTALDFVFIDTEHIPLERMELAHMCRTYQAYGLTPIVRILQPDPYRAGQVIDDGAIGVIAPYLEQPEQIRELVGAIKYRPLKGERLDAVLHGSATLPAEMQTYLERHNFGNLVIANVESVPALERLDELLTVDGLDGVFIGPHDLSISMGIPEQYDHPDFVAAVKTIIQKARKHTLGVGIHFSETPQRQIDWVKEGVNIVIHSSDMSLFKQRLLTDIGAIRAASGDGGNGSQSNDPVNEVI